MIDEEAEVEEVEQEVTLEGQEEVITGGQVLCLSKVEEEEEMLQEGQLGEIPGVEGLQEVATWVVVQQEVELGEVIMEEMTAAMTVTQQVAHSHSQTPLIAIVAMKPSRELCKRMDQPKEESSLFVDSLGKNNATFSYGQINHNLILLLPKTFQNYTVIVDCHQQGEQL